MRTVPETSHQAIGTNGGHDIFSTNLVAWALCLFPTVTFIVCETYGLATPQSLHMYAFLEQIPPVFK